MNRHLSFFVGIAVLFSVTTAHGQATIGTDTADQVGSSLSLQEAVAIAIKHNLLVNQADITAQAGRINLNQAYDYMLPTINASGNEGIGFGRSAVTSSYSYTTEQTTFGNYNASANLNLFSGLQVQNGIRQYRLAYNASKLDLEQQKNSITLSVLLAYLQILSNHDQLAIAIDQANVDSAQVGRLDTLNQAGALLLLSNLTDLRGQYAGDLANIAIVRNNLEASKVNLFNLLNVPYKRDVEFDRNAFTLSISEYTEGSDSIYARSLETMPSIRAAELRVQSYQKALSAARGAYYPSLSFFANASTNYSSSAPGVLQSSSPAFDTTGNFVNVGGSNYNVIAPYDKQSFRAASWSEQVKANKAYSIGLQLNIPILNYLQTRNRVKQAKLNLKNQQLVNNNTRLVLQQNVETAYQNMISAYKQYKAYMEQAAAYSESFRTTQIRFNEGVVNSDVYILSKNNADRANVSLAAAKYTYIFRTKVLDYYQGKLNVQQP
jgi:outer membrane protein